MLVTGGGGGAGSVGETGTTDGTGRGGDGGRWCRHPSSDFPGAPNSGVTYAGGGGGGQGCPANALW